MEVSPSQVLGPLDNGVSLDPIGRSGRSQRKRKPCQEKEDGVVRVVSPHPPLIPGSVTQGPVGEGAGQAAIEGGSFGGAAVVQSAGVGFVVQGTSNGNVVSPAVTHALG